MKKIIIFLMMLVPCASMAQSGTNSPYSQYGLGLLSDQSTGFNRGMDGVALGIDHSYVLPGRKFKISDVTVTKHHVLDGRYSA